MNHTSRLQRRTTDQPSDRVVTTIKSQGRSDSHHDPASPPSSATPGHDFSHVNLFANDPGPRSHPNLIQARLTVGAPNDPYEQEADRVAEQVMAMPDPNLVQREALPEEDELQMKSLGQTIQREALPEEDELQMKSLGQTIQREALPEEDELQMKSLGQTIQREALPEEDELQMKSLGQTIQREALPEEDELQMKSLGQTIQREALPEEDELQMKSLGQTIQREALPEEDELQMKSLGQTIQREALPEEDELQMKFLGQTIQREVLPEEEDELQMKSLGQTIRREALPEEEEPVQAKSAIQRSADGDLTASSNLETQLNQSKGSGSPLPDPVRSFMEPRFGADFSQVRVHTGSEAVQMNQSLQAQAFTHGQDIYYGAGKAPNVDHLTGHELTHVLQQTGRKTTPAAIGSHVLKGQTSKSPVLSHLQAMHQPLGVDASVYRKEIAEFQNSHSTAEIIAKQQQLLPAKNGSITQTGDRSKIFRACGDSNAAGEITHETKFNAPDGSPKTRKTVGVGEEVQFKAPTAGKWTASSGLPVLLANGDTFDWTAPSRAASVVIKFEAGGKHSSVTMNVLEPDNITATKKSNIGYAAGRQGAGMTLTFNYHPMSVSFGNVEAKEVSGPATNITGYFKKNYSPADLWHNSGDTFFPIGADNKDTATDTASFNGYPRPWAKGGWDWQIPNHFKVKTEGGDGKKFTTVTQAFSLAADGESTVEKAGASVTRKP